MPHVKANSYSREVEKKQHENPRDKPCSEKDVIKMQVLERRI